MCNWCNVNQLTINLQKCHVIIISPKINLSVMDFSVMFNNSPITLKNHVRYLGVFINFILNFYFYLNVVNKLSRAVSIKYRLKHILLQNVLLSL